MALMTTDEIMESWPSGPKQQVQQLRAKYGEPQEGDMEMLVWTKVAPWKRIEVRREEIEHLFPKWHKESTLFYLEHSVPLAKTIELLQFNGSMLIDRTKGEVVVRAKDEPTAILELNIAQDLAQEKLTLNKAQELLATEVELLESGQPCVYSQQLLFTKAKRADPGTIQTSARIDELKEEVERIGEQIKQLGERIKQAAH